LIAGLDLLGFSCCCTSWLCPP